MNTSGISILALLVIINLIWIFCVLIYAIIQWKDNLILNKGNPKIKFKQFKDWYYINPDRWSIDKYGVTFCTDSFLENYCLSFNFFQYILYCIWKHKLNHKKVKDRKQKQLIKIMETVQKDINNYREEYKNSTKEAVGDILDIIENQNRQF